MQEVAVVDTLVGTQGLATGIVVILMALALFWIVKIWPEDRRIRCAQAENANRQLALSTKAIELSTSVIEQNSDIIKGNQECMRQMQSETHSLSKLMYQHDARAEGIARDQAVMAAHVEIVKQKVIEGVTG